MSFFKYELKIPGKNSSEMGHFVTGISRNEDQIKGDCLPACQGWEAPDHLHGVLPQNWGRIEPNRTVTCMVLKDMASNMHLEIAFKIKEVPKQLKGEILLNILGERVNLLVHVSEEDLNNYKEPSCVGNSKDIALKLLGSLWNSLASDENYLNLYREFLRDYEKLGYMKEVTDEKLNPKSRIMLPIMEFIVQKSPQQH
ncbi:hypothetical protein TNCV_4982731 [Trichonephila clavipes]|uniref:Uncharacterized protein n=1 Tax=Trichonephila clavipes TaxID=2585209 RepID=A0A8X6WFW9_TRICX|nr:hypothetical protein TNCV_4982731 [Trichonephila clavipes]